jgi:hypothetical protein
MAQYLLVSEGNHYEIMPGPENRPDLIYVLLTLEKYEKTILKFSEVKLVGTDELEFILDLVDSPNKDLTEKDDELQLIASSVMQDIIRNTTLDKSAEFINPVTGEKIER